MGDIGALAIGIAGRLEDPRDRGEQRVVRERAPALLADQAVADVGVPVAPSAAPEDGVVGVDEGEPLGEPSDTQVVGEPGDLVRIVERDAGFSSNRIANLNYSLR